MFFDQDLVRVRPGTRTDRSGNTLPDWSEDAVDRLTLHNISMQPSGQDETTTAERTAVVTGWRAQSAPGDVPDVLASDRIEWRGMTLEVIGEVAPWSDPIDGSTHHVEWSLTRVTG